MCQTDSTDLTRKKTWNDVFDEVTDPEEVDLKKTDQILVTVSDRAGQTFEPDMEEPIQVVQEFDRRLKFATFTVNRFLGKTSLAFGFLNAF